MSSIAVSFPPEYDKGRLHLQVFSAYVWVVGTMMLFAPATFLAGSEPILQAISSFTGLPVGSPPQTTAELGQNALISALIIGIGCVYSALSGPFWDQGGKVLVELSNWTRLTFAGVLYYACFATPYGSALLFLIATIDVLAAIHLTWLVGSGIEDVFRGRIRKVAVPSKLE